MSFPSSPTVGQQASEGGRLYAWDGYAWSLIANVGVHAAQHAAAGSDPITPASIGAASSSHAHAAGDIESGTLSDERLSFKPLHPFLLMGG